MANKILVVVDMQNDFLTGSLANESDVNVIPNIKREIESGKYTHIIFTRDTHTENYLNTQEGKRLPVTHCVQGTDGWKVCDAFFEPGINNNIWVNFLDKPTFGYKEWNKFFEDNGLNGDDSEFTFTGTCTDICVVSNVLAVKAAFPEAHVKCIADCCAPLFGDHKRQESALTVMESCQVDVIR
jgi:nicotinamidase-related amidase